MPYTIKVDKRAKRPYRIVNEDTGKVVGTSTSKKKAMGSIAHRMGSEKKMPMSKKSMPRKSMSRRKRD